VLVILRAEDRDLRGDDVEELQDDGRDAAKVSRPEFAFELVLDRRRVELILLRLGVEIGFGRREQHVDAGGFELGAVVGKSPRVFVEVLVRTELQAVDKDARDDRFAVRARLLHQRDMPRVQIAHRRDENDAATVRERGAQVGN